MEPNLDLPMYEYLSKVASMGQRAIVTVDDVTFERLQDIPRSLEMVKQYTDLAGAMINAANQVESSLNPILTYLLNPLDPGRVRPAVLSLMFSAKINMFNQMLDQDWDDGKAVIRHLETMREFRNRLAHSVWEGTRVDDDGHLEEGPFLGGPKKNKRTGWAHVEAKVSIEEMQERILQAEVLSTVLESLLDIWARERYTGEATFSKIPLGAAVFVMSQGYKPPATSEWSAMLLNLFPFDAREAGRLIQPPHSAETGD
jgi:hypothetical protein